MAARDPYQVLGLGRAAGEAEIKTAYRKLAKSLHPDLHPGDSVIENRFKEVSAAHDLLSDPDKRRRYDLGELDADGNAVMRRPPPGARRRGPNVEEAAAAAQSRDDILSDLMETMRAARNRVFAKAGADVSYRLNLDLKDAAQGTKTRIKLKDGRMLDVKIPAGVREGHVIRLRGQGDPGTGGAPSGDGLVEIHLNVDPDFRLEGDDIHRTLPISLVEAVQGAKVVVETMDGSVTLSVPPGSSGGKILRLKAKGWPKSTGGRGDFYVTLQIALPGKIDADLKEFVETWGRDHPYNPR